MYGLQILAGYFWICVLKVGHLFDVLGVRFTKALFVPNTSLYFKVGNNSLPQTEVDLSWQFKLQSVWENLMQANKGTGSY